MLEIFARCKHHRLGLTLRVCSTSCHQSPVHQSHQSPVYQRVYAADFNFHVWSFFLAGDPEECLSQWRRFSCPLDLSLGVWGRVSSQDVAKMGADKDFRKQAMQFTSSSLTATCQLCAVSLGDFQWQDSEHQRHDSSWIGVGLGFWESFHCCNIKAVMYLFWEDLQASILQCCILWWVGSFGSCIWLQSSVILSRRMSSPVTNGQAQPVPLDLAFL